MFEFSRRWLATVAACAITSLLVMPGMAHAADVVKADAGEYFSFAVLRDGSLWGWGYNAQGQLGDGTVETHLAPSRTDFGNNWNDVSAGRRHVLALKDGGTLWTWGENFYGQLGIGHAEGVYNPGHWHNTPTQVGVGLVWEKVSAGGNHSVAIDEDHRIWAWGGNEAGQLGIGSTVPTMVTEPTLVSAPGPGLFWRDVWTSIPDPLHGPCLTLALASDGSFWQWGDGVTTPTLVGFTGGFGVPAIESDNCTVSVAGDNVSAVLRDTSLWTWKAGLAPPTVRFGWEYLDVAEMLDEGALNPVQAAMMVAYDRTLRITTDLLSNGPAYYVIPTNATNWDQVVAGENHFLASKTDGSLWGWGRNFWGQLGNGSDTDRVSRTQAPVRVILPTPIPSVVGMTQSDAEKRIEEMGFRVGTVSQVATTGVEITRIISQTPTPTTLVMPNLPVHIVVSAGPPIPVPNVVGLAEAAARASIGAVGLGVSTVTQAYSSDVPSGSVISQEPVAGTGVILASKVALTISKGPQAKPVPYTSGKTEALARTSLTSAGFVVGSVYTEYSTRYAKGYVTRTDPVAGVQTLVGATVNLYLSLGKPQAWVRTPIAPRTMRKTSSYTVYGYLKPRHTSGTYPVRIYKWKKTSSGKWRSYGYVTAKASNYSTYTKYRKLVRLSIAGRWRLRAYAPADSNHAATWSTGYDYVTVR